MRADLSDALILGGALVALVAAGWLFGPAVAALATGVLVSAFGFALHFGGRFR